MKRSEKKTRALVRSLCAQIHDDDGPQNRHRKEHRDRTGIDRKSMQLCAQVRRSLNGLIPVPSDPAFDNSRLESVEPAPDSARLKVILSVEAPAPAQVVMIRARLAALQGYLRAQVAADINRKQAPVLIFELVPRHEGEL
ncbi:MAG: ribosome-binding factor A [Planctomycetes bacterium]|nr:ribosome-binding factor A [Planctomycetota bacterium]NOG54513.1 ribosome-binding factor A [Planctomycetota bacterium]